MGGISEIDDIMHTELNFHLHYARITQCASGQSERGKDLSGYTQLKVRKTIDPETAKAKFPHNQSIVGKLQDFTKSDSQ